MDNNEKTSEKITKWLLVGISVLFLAVMLLLPLITVITEALRSGWKVYAAAVTDEYTIKALLLTVKATLFAVVFNTVFGVFAAWALTKFQFRGNAQTPGVHYLLDSREGRPQAFAMQFILEPGNISIKSDAEDPQVRHTTGTPANSGGKCLRAQAASAALTEIRTFDWAGEANKRGR